MALIVQSHDSVLALNTLYPPTILFDGVTLVVANKDVDAENGSYRCFDDGTGSSYQWHQLTGAGADEIGQGTFSEMLLDDEMKAWEVGTGDVAGEEYEGFWFKRVGAGWQQLT